MKILLVNDDGYFAKGIQYVKEYLVSKGHEVCIVAPKTEKSAASSSLTIRGTLKKERIDENTYAVEGTPVDCVKLGLATWDKGNAPDLVISGINMGTNLGTDTLYSGTVGAALDAAVMGFRALALSTNREFMQEGPGSDFDEYLGKAIDIAMSSAVPLHTMLNINIPRTNIKGVKYIQTGMVIYRGDYEPCAEKENEYCLNGVRDDQYNLSNEVDDRYFYESYMTVTPLSYNLTDYKTLEKLYAEAKNQ